MRRLKICTAHHVLFGGQIEKNEMGWACSTRGERRGVYRVLLGKPEEKRPLGGSRRRWEVGWGAWTGLSWLMIWTDGGLFCTR